LKIAAGIVVYADPEGLDRCLSTLALGRGGFDGAIIIHSRYEHFDLEDPRSLEDTQRVASKYHNVLVHNVEEPITQVDARSLYMEKAGELGYDWLMVIDSDEYVLQNADWGKFRSQLEYVLSLNPPHQIFDIDFDGSIIYRGARPRLFLDPGTVRYWVKHWWFILTKKGILCKGNSDSGRIIEGINVYHSKLVRSLEHIQASNLYYQWQELIEAPAEDPATHERELKRLQEFQDSERAISKRVV
jgi:hypothetical protein